MRLAEVEMVYRLQVRQRTIFALRRRWLRQNGHNTKSQIGLAAHQAVSPGRDPAGNIGIGSFHDETDVRDPRLSFAQEARHRRLRLPSFGPNQHATWTN